MSHRHLLILFGLVLVAIGLFERGWMLLAIWLGVNFIVLGIAHAQGFHLIFGKRRYGSLPIWSWLVFLPFVLYTIAVWHMLREPAQNEVTEEFFMGARPDR